MDRVEWVWLGALSADGLTVSVRLADGRRQAVVVATPAAGGAAVRSPMVAAGEHRIASIRLGGLASDSGVHVPRRGGRRRRSVAGAGRFRTPGAGATSFRFAVASCARTGSNGAVYDAIVATEPLLFLETRRPPLREPHRHRTGAVPRRLRPRARHAGPGCPGPHGAHGLRLGRPRLRPERRRRRLAHPAGGAGGVTTWRSRTTPSPPSTGPIARRSRSVVCAS